MNKFVFYYTELTSGNKYKENVMAENFRAARDTFFDKHQHTPHRIDVIWNETKGERIK